MNRTPIGRLLFLAVAAVGIAWPLDLLLLEFWGAFLPIGPTGTAVLAIAAQALGIWGWLVRDRLPKLDGQTADGKPNLRRALNPLPPLLAARTAALAMAASRVGSFCAGFYAGLGLAAVTNWGLQVAGQHLLIAATTALVSLALAAVGVWLERICSLPPTPPAASAEAV